MVNPFTFMRQRNIFSNPVPGEEDASTYRKRFTGGGTTPTPTNPDGSVIDEGSDDNADATSPFDSGRNKSNYDSNGYFNEMERIRKNKGPAVTAYQQHLENIPTHEAFAPSKMRHVAAVLGGIGAGLNGAGLGVATAQGILNTPYETALGEYKTKAAGLGESAKLEQDDTEAQLKSLSEARALGLKYDEYMLKKTENDRKDRIDRGNLAVAQNRAETYAKSVNDPKFDYIDQADGSVLAIDKSDPNNRHIVPAKTVTAANLRVSEYNANTARGAANTNKRNVDSLIEDRPKRREIDKIRAEKTGQRQPANATQQSKAIDNELSLMFREPQYRNYIKAGGSSDREPWDIAEDDGTSGYKAFRNELSKRVKASLASGDPFGGDEGADDEDDSIIITPRGGR